MLMGGRGDRAWALLLPGEPTRTARPGRQDAGAGEAPLQGICTGGTLRQSQVVVST